MTRHSAPVDASTLEHLGRSLAHRGPDDRGFLVYDGRRVSSGREPLAAEHGRVALVHRRLSILDLSEGGWQPMSTEDGRYHIIYNGEIYNYLELRAELEGRGVHFRTSSDTEVLLALLAADGPDALPKLTGMFALALLDVRDRLLLLARDPFGIKPLYYSHNDRTLAFASELKALLTLPWIGRGVHASRVFDYLRYGVTDHGADTMLSAVQQIPPAHYLTLPLDGPWSFASTPFWDPRRIEAERPTFAQASERLRETFLRSVRLHLRSDVPVGAALSGGIDSSAIVMAVRRVAGPSAEIHAFTYSAGHGAVNEEPYADLVAAAAGARLHKVNLEASDLGGDVDRLIDAQDFPFGSTTIYAQYRVFALAREQGITVMLDGQGADELLGGYQYFVAARLGSLLRQRQWLAAAQFLRRAFELPGDNAMKATIASRVRMVLGSSAFVIPRSFRSALQALVGRAPAPQWLESGWFRERGVHPRSMHFDVGGPHVLRGSLCEAVTHTSLPHLLRYEDRNSMAWSIESRVPFLTTEFAAHALALPEEYLINTEAQTKAIFRHAMRGIVPDAVLDRRDKIGFSTPEAVWLGQLAPWIDRVLKDALESRVPLFAHDALRSAWERQRSSDAPADRQVWRWCNFLVWARRIGATFE